MPRPQLRFMKMTFFSSLTQVRYSPYAIARESFSMLTGTSSSRWKKSLSGMSSVTKYVRL